MNVTKEEREGIGRKGSRPHCAPRVICERKTRFFARFQLIIVSFFIG